MVFRVNAAENAAIKSAAEDKDVCLSEFCRSVLLRAIGMDQLADLEIVEETYGKERKSKRRPEERVKAEPKYWWESGEKAPAGTT